MDAGPDLPVLSDKTIDLAHTIDQYNRLRAPYFRDLHPSTIALLSFVLARNPTSGTPSIPESWPIDRSTLNNAVKEFHEDVSHLGNCEEFRKWERALAERSPNTRIPAKPLGFRKGSGKDSLLFPTNFASDFRNTRLSPASGPATESSRFPNLQQPMDPPEETGFTASQKNELQTMIAEALAAAIRNSQPGNLPSPGPPGSPGPQGAPTTPVTTSTTTNASPAWKTEDLGYFHPDLPDKDDAAVKTVSNQTHYRDVLVFLDRLRDLVTLKGEELIRANIHASLRGSALAWYTSELSEFERRSIRHMPLEEGWLLMLRQRFKMRPSQALMKLADTTFSPTDVRAGKSVRGFAQSIFRYAQAAEITSAFNQITQAWSKLSPQLRRDIPEPTPDTTITEFLGVLEAKEAIWKDIAAQPRYNQRRPRYDRDEEQEYYPRHPPQRSQGYYPSYQNQYKRPSNQGYNSGPQWNRQRSPRPPHRPQNGPQKLLTDKPDTSDQNNRNKQPWNQQRASSYPARDQRPSAYQTGLPQEDANGSQPAQSEYYLYEDDPLESYNDFSHQETYLNGYKDDEEAYDCPQEGVSCLHCHQDFPSNNKLHEHLPGCAGPTEPTAFHIGICDEVIESTRTEESSRPGYRFRPWRYASAQVFLVHNKENPLTVCLDTGCSMTIMDDSFAQELGLTRHNTEPIPVNGIAAVLVSTEYVIFDVFFPGINPRKIEMPQVTGKITIEAHIVSKLKSKLLIGIDVLAPEAITMDFMRKTATIASCGSMEFPITLRAKPHHRTPRSVCAAERTVIPPNSQAQIPISVKGSLEEDRDYIFEPCLQRPVFFAQAVDSGFAFVHAINRTEEPMVIHRKDRLGHISEFDFTEALQVGTEATELTSSDPVDPSTVRPSIIPDRSSKELVTPEGITIYDDDKSADKFRQIAQSYDIWRDTGPAEIPEELHMQIPLVEGWEKKRPKPKVYPLSTEDQKLVDETFDKLHSQNRMEWAKEHTPSGYPVFVAYRNVHRPDGSTIRKGRVVVDLRGLNKIVEQDVYPLPLQEEIIAMVAGCAYVTVVDAVSFFYQWMIRKDHQKFKIESQSYGTAGKRL
jgi:hypothetical protein